MLSIEGLKVAYGHVEALRGIDLEARQGEITAIIGSNGAGKTSTLMAISGLAPISAGDIRFEGQSIARRRPHDITRLGITHILEGRQLFADQTVADNLLLGGYTRLPRHRARVAELLEREMTRFPILRERRAQLAGTLSGGEQQMLAIARGLMSEHCARKERPSSWSSRWRLWHCAWPTAPMCSKTGRSNCPAPAPNSPTRPRCAAPISAAEP
jgi:branched-chain amino acid transport system ATP-binding protein